MLPARIKKRPIRFTLWLLALLFIWPTMESYRTWFQYAGGGYRLILVEGRLTAQRNTFSSRQGLYISDGWSTSGPFTPPLIAFFRPPRLSSNELSIPLGWPLLLLTSITTFSFWHPLKKPDPALCLQCGYNLTANTTGKCPECDHAIHIPNTFRK